MPITIKLRRNWGKIKSEILKEWKMPEDEDDVGKTDDRGKKLADPLDVYYQQDHGVSGRKGQGFWPKMWF